MMSTWYADQIHIKQHHTELLKEAADERIIRKMNANKSSANRTRKTYLNWKRNLAYLVLMAWLRG